MTPRFTPAVLDYWSRLSARPAYQSALRAQERAAGEQGVATTPAPDAACRLPLAACRMISQQN